MRLTNNLLDTKKHTCYDFIVKKNSRGVAQNVLVIALLIIGAVAYYFGINKGKSMFTSSPATIVDVSSAWKSYEFKPVSLTLKAPPDFTVEASEPNEGSDFTAYIQNAAFNKGDVANSYQLYIYWQKLPPLSQAEFEKLRDGLIPESVTETKIDGFPAIQGQIKGERNRFATFILHNKGRISFLTSQPTEINKKITEEILSTLKFTN